MADTVAKLTCRSVTAGSGFTQPAPRVLLEHDARHAPTAVTRGRGTLAAGASGGEEQRATRSFAAYSVGGGGGGRPPSVDDTWHRKVLVSHATERPAALNATHAIVEALRQQCDPATGKPFSAHCHADSRVVDLWLEPAGGGAVRAVREGVCAVFFLSDAFCASPRCTRELQHATLKGRASIPVFFERLSGDGTEVDAVRHQTHALRSVDAFAGVELLVCADCRDTSGGGPCASCSQWTVAVSNQPTGDLTAAVRQLGRLVDAEVERAVRRAQHGALRPDVMGAPDASFLQPGEFLPAPARTPHLEPEPELTQEDGVVEIILPGEYVDGEAPSTSAVVTEIKAAIVDALWAEMEQMDVRPASDAPGLADGRLVVLVRKCEQGHVASTLMQGVTVEALDVQLCRCGTPSMHIRIVTGAVILTLLTSPCLLDSSCGENCLISRAPEVGGRGPGELRPRRKRTEPAAVQGFGPLDTRAHPEDTGRASLGSIAVPQHPLRHASDGGSDRRYSLLRRRRTRSLRWIYQPAEEHRQHGVDR